MGSSRPTRSTIRAPTPGGSRPCYLRAPQPQLQYEMAVLSGGNGPQTASPGALANEAEVEVGQPPLRKFRRTSPTGLLGVTSAPGATNAGGTWPLPKVSLLMVVFG